MTETLQFTVEMRPVASLRANPLNYNRHSADQLGRLADSLRVHGQAKPLVITADGELLAGHGLWEAMQAMGWESAACHVYHGSNPAAYLIADNYLATLAEPDEAALAAVLKDLESAGTLLDTGFDEREFAELMARLEALNPAPVSEEGPIPEPQEGPTRVQAGEVWQLGKHRIICGDCSKAEDVDRLLAGAKLNLIVTSPPYAEQRKEQYGGVPADEYVDWFVPIARMWRERLAEDGSFFLNIKEHCENGERHLYVKWLVIGLRGDGWKFVDEFAWLRTGLPGAWPDRFKNGWEPCFHFAHASPKFRPQNVSEMGLTKQYTGTDRVTADSGIPSNVGMEVEGLVRPNNVMDFKETADSGSHAAAYPVRLPAFFLKAYSDPSDTVLDPFLGSGTTLIAAEQTGRVAYGMEILPKYCDVILARWEKLTGKEALRAD